MSAGLVNSGLAAIWEKSRNSGLYSAYTSKAIGFTALEDVAEAAALILMEGPEKHRGKDYWFSAEVPPCNGEVPAKAGTFSPSAIGTRKLLERR